MSKNKSWSAAFICGCAIISEENYHQVELLPIQYTVILTCDFSESEVDLKLSFKYFVNLQFIL